MKLFLKLFTFPGKTIRSITDKLLNYLDSINFDDINLNAVIDFIISIAIWCLGGLILVAIFS